MSAGSAAATSVLPASLATPARASDVRAGVRAMAPLTLAYVPFGLLVGAAAAQCADPVAAWLATWTIYGGAAHLAVLDVLSQGSGWVVAAGVGLLVNARLLAYAAAMAPDWRTAPVRRRAAAGLVLSDAPWALANGRDSGRRDFYAGAAATLFVIWPLLVTLGFLGADWIVALPVAALLPPLTLGVVVVPQLRERPAARAAVAATTAALLTLPLEAGLSMLACCAAGVLAAASVREGS